MVPKTSLKIRVAGGTAIDPQEAPKSDELAALDGVITTEVKSTSVADLRPEPAAELRYARPIAFSRHLRM